MFEVALTLCCMFEVVLTFVNKGRRTFLFDALKFLQTKRFLLASFLPELFHRIKKSENEAKKVGMEISTSPWTNGD
jgi:hypothetical protein